LPFFVFAQTPEPDACVSCTEPGGMVPCGRKCDDPTTAKNECDPCTLCDFFVLADKIIDAFLTSIIPVLIILIAGIAIMTAYIRKGSSEIINSAKKTLTGVVIGIIILYCSWAIVNSFLAALGYVSWSGLDDMWTISCPGPEAPVSLEETYCGDNIVQHPNQREKLVEVCDGTDLSFRKCEDFGYKEGEGELKCLDDCTDFDFSSCVELPAPDIVFPGLPEPTPLNPEPLVAAPTGKGEIEEEFKYKSVWKYYPCTNIGVATHWLGKDYNTWVLKDDQGIDAIKITCDKEYCVNYCRKHDLEYCGEQVKLVECLNGHVLIEPDDLGKCERGSVVFIRISATKALYACTDYEHRNASSWNYVCKLEGESQDSIEHLLTEPVCPNNIKERDEVCDGVDLDGVECADLDKGYEGGNLSCLADCSGYDDSQCLFVENSKCYDCKGNSFGFCDQTECERLGDDCVILPVETIFTESGRGTMCASIYNCKACGSVLGDTCNQEECNRINSEKCKYTSPDPADLEADGGTCILE